MLFRSNSTDGERTTAHAPEINLLHPETADGTGHEGNFRELSAEFGETCIDVCKTLVLAADLGEPLPGLDHIA